MQTDLVGEMVEIGSWSKELDLDEGGNRVWTPVGTGFIRGVSESMPWSFLVVWNNGKITREADYTLRVADIEMEPTPFLGRDTQGMEHRG